MMRAIFRSLLAAAFAVWAGRAMAIDLALPTKNDFLFRNQPEKFYMHVDRWVDGKKTTPWQGGCYGYVRNPVLLGEETVCTKFHEGIDIAPIDRDPAGEPLDVVMAISPGKVVHTSIVAKQSNYGKYVVVEHEWDRSRVYSLYAHLSEVKCAVGDVVETGSPLGRMGYTGAGINRARSHLHLEVALLMSRRYDDWHRHIFHSGNPHGIYNGMNLSGADVARLFLEHRANPTLRFSDFMARTPAYFKVLTPSHGAKPDFASRYPWLVRGDTAGNPVSWEFTFSATGLPIAVAPGTREVTEPIVSAVRKSAHPHRYLTRNLITGEGDKAVLGRSGKQLIALLTDDFPAFTKPETPPASE